jgi:hypothetical protein
MLNQNPCTRYSSTINVNKWEHTIKGLPESTDTQQQRSLD